METLLDRFLRYIAYDTASNPESQSQPSTNKQFVLLEILKNELGNFSDFGILYKMLL